jgi:hypothetical protein
MVNPRIPLTICGETIRRSKNLKLTKDEVKHALKHGPVYRKFSAKTIERVTLQNIDSLHVKVKGRPDKPVKVKIEDAVTPIVNLPVKDEVKIIKGETPTPDTIKPVEEVVETKVEAVDNASEEVKSESVVETKVEAVATTEEVKTNNIERNNKFQNIHYDKKKKNR